MRTASLMMAASLAASGVAAAAEPAQPPRHEAAAMLYFSKSFGGDKGHRPAAPVFGLRLSEFSVDSNRPIVDMLNLRMRLNGSTTVSALGLVNYRFNSANYDAAAEGSGGGEEKSHKALWITLGIAGALGVACLAEVGICEDDDDDGYEAPSPEGPG